MEVQAQLADQHCDHSAMVAAIQGGCPHAEAEMCRRFERPMRRVLARYADNPTDADDWLNSSWVLALDKVRRGELRDPRALPGFLCGIARRVAAGEVRQRWRQDTKLTGEELDAHAGEEDIYEAVSAHQLVEHTTDLVGKLPVPRDREVFLRCFLAGEDKQDVAQSMNIDSSMLGKILYRARKRLWDAAEQAQVAGSLKEFLN